MNHDPEKSKQGTGVLLVNLGTPDAPTPAALRRYLGEFLWDPRVVEIPRPIWWLILHGIILRVRPKKSAHAYEKVWTERGSPLMVFTEDLGHAVAAVINEGRECPIRVDVAMRYGNPSLREKLEGMRKAGIERLIVVPLYPQFAAATTASIFDRVTDVMKSWRSLPELCVLSDYHREPGYIEAIAESIEIHWRANGRGEILLFSFHGLPERSRALGDPYYGQCQATAAAIVQRLKLEPGQARVVFQSRFGPAEWLKPYCVDTLQSLPSEGVRSVDVICPGFAVDCLETLEEIAITNREVFMEAGGERYCYIPALNAGTEHARLLADLIARRIG